MELVLILGPMKSGKSFELINYFSPLRYTGEAFKIFHSAKNVRDEKVQSRDGASIDSEKVESLSVALNKHYPIIGIDEVHMFDPNEADIVGELLYQRTKVVAAGLHTDYQGKMFEIVKRLLELGPKEVRYKRAVCEKCRSFDAVHTQVLKKGAPLVEDGLPPSLPDDGTYTYKPLCHRCFIKR